MSFLIAGLALLTVIADPAGPTAEYARIQTSMGDIYVELEAERAPVTVANFLEYAESGYYDRLVFHRVIDGVLIQGGGYSRSLYPRATRDPIVSESDNGLRNLRGTIAMARYDDPDSATSQFFINLQDNPDLDRQGDEFKMDAGYTVFGKVVSGLDVADAIGAVPTGSGDGGVFLETDVPLEPVYIERIDPVDADEVEAALP
ncbi:MAG: peptidylprolyl isomerase [Parvularcula sp.]|jgi:cyclophilin family peptidyl-prolyl cis-trans isomerase|nr:peptidylprolyl isomerase [Parvularcula sp.]